MSLKMIGWFILWVIPIAALLLGLVLKFVAPVLPDNPWIGMIGGWVTGATAVILAWLAVLWQTREHRSRDE